MGEGVRRTEKAAGGVQLLCGGVPGRPSASEAAKAVGSRHLGECVPLAKYIKNTLPGPNIITQNTPHTQPGSMPALWF